jgi:hypothetical protein
MAPLSFLNFRGRKLVESAFLLLPKLPGTTLTPIGEIDEVVVFLLNLPMFQYEKGSSCWLLELGSYLAKCCGITPCCLSCRS